MAGRSCLNRFVFILEGVGVLWRGLGYIVVALKPMPNQTSAGPVRVIVALPVLLSKSRAMYESACADPMERILPVPCGIECSR